MALEKYFLYVCIYSYVVVEIYLHKYPALSSYSSALSVCYIYIILPIKYNTSLLHIHNTAYKIQHQFVTYTLYCL